MRSAGRPPSVPPARNPLISLTVACSQQLWPDSCGVSGRQAGGLPRGLRQTVQCSGRNTLKTTAYRPGFATAPVGQKALVSPPLAPYTGQRRRGRVVEGTPLLRVQTGNRLEGSNPFVSATLPVSAQFKNAKYRRFPHNISARSNRAEPREIHFPLFR